MNAISEKSLDTARGGFISREDGRAVGEMTIAPKPCGRISGPRWFVAETHPQAERWVARSLAEKGYEAYLPMIVRQRRDSVVRTMMHTVHVPMFGNYLFFRIDADNDPWTPVRYCEGVKQVFMTQSQRPIPVPIGFVERLIETAPERLKLAPEKLPAHPRGAMLRIESGPMESFTGICVASDGLTTEMNVELFGRVLVVTFPSSVLSLAPR